MTLGSRRLLNYRLLAASAIAVLTMATIGVGVARAISRGDNTSSKYKVEVTATREASSDFFNFDLTVRDRTSGKLIASAKLRSAVEKWGIATSGTRSRTGEENETVIRMIGHADDTVEVETTVNHEPPIITKLIAQRPDSRLKPAQGISITLKDADIHDVLRTFAQLTKTDIVVDDGISGQVTVDLVDVPWTKALDIVLRQNNLRFERTDDTIHVHRR
jgi:hypothetical protein